MKLASSFIREMTVVTLVTTVVFALLIARVVQASAENQLLGSLATVFWSGYHLTLWNYDVVSGIAAFTLLHYLLAYLLEPIPFCGPDEQVLENFMVLFLLVVLAGVVLGVVQIATGFAPTMFSPRYKRDNRMPVLAYYLKRTLSVTLLLFITIGTSDYLPVANFTLRTFLTIVTMPLWYYLLVYRWMRTRITCNGRASGQVHGLKAVEPLYSVMPVHAALFFVVWLARMVSPTINEQVRARAILIGVYALCVALVFVVLSIVGRRRGHRR